MRLAPVIIVGFASRRPGDIVTMARVSTRETRYSFEAEAATEVFVALLVNAMRGLRKDATTDVSWARGASARSEDFERVHARTISTDPAVRAEAEERTTGYVVHGLALAVYGLMDFDSFESGAPAIASLGGDANTNAAIYGQFVGAHYGVEAIPQTRRDAVFEGGEILFPADDLLACRICEESRTRFAEDL